MKYGKDVAWDYYTERSGIRDYVLANYSGGPAPEKFEPDYYWIEAKGLWYGPFTADELSVKRVSAKQRT